MRPSSHLLGAALLSLSVACGDDASQSTTRGSSATGASGAGAPAGAGGAGGDAPQASSGAAESSNSGSSDGGAGGGAGAGGDGGATPAGAILVQFGDDLPPAIAERLLGHLEGAAPGEVIVIPPDDLIPAAPEGSVVVAFGDTTARRDLIGDDEVSDLPAEGYVMRTGEVAGLRAIVEDGVSASDEAFGSGAIGSGFGAYALLEHLGFAFLHPLAPTAPAAIDLAFADVDRTTSPRWPVRGLQLHTMHPLELTDLLNGWGVDSPEDRAGWESMLPEWDTFLEWSLANGQNRVHWVLLWAEPWGVFGDSEERRARLETLVDHAHDFAVGAGIDTPIRQQQQQTFRMIRQDGTLEEEIAQIDTRIDWLMSAGFDYLATEMGSTEFTSTDDVRTVAWMNEVTSRVEDVHGKHALVKVHTSSGQTVDNYTDPQTGEPLNYNHLPHYADPRLGIMPHTVQHYGLDDPAPTYGNTDFGFVRAFLQEEVGLRPVIWHPETAYWVSFDVDVPLFLPLYAHRRVHDLRLLAGDEDEGRMGRGANAGGHMDGQLTFSSGWEWGYWLQEVVTARAAWTPPMDAADDDAALAVSLDPVVKAFGPAAEPMRDILVRLSRAQLELLIEGRIGGVLPDDIEKRNGQAYLQGVEAWDDISDLAVSLPGNFTMTQPDRVGLIEMRNPFHDPPGYSSEVEPLLAEMESRFTSFADEVEAQRAAIPEGAMPLFEDIAVGTRMLALRARQIHGLYDYVDAYWDGSDAFKAARLGVARDSLDQAWILAQAQEDNYRVPADRIAGWRDNPTAYAFTYLWTVRSLFYWWRDEGKAVDAPLSPCYLNIINPATLAMGEGTLSSATDTLAEVFDETGGIGSAAECAGVPESEPIMPPAGLRP